MLLYGRVHLRTRLNLPSENDPIAALGGSEEIHSVLSLLAIGVATCPARRGGFCFIGETMTRVYRISEGPDVGDILDSVEALQASARDHGPGRYDVDEHSRDRTLDRTCRIGRGAG
jgi:hypothetical protein